MFRLIEKWFRMQSYTVLILFCFSSSCGTFVGNPEGDDETVPAKNRVEISSEALGSGATSIALATVDHFSFCVKRMKLKFEGSNVENLVDFDVGLLDLSNGLEQAWGTIEVSAGAKISELRVIAEVNAETCGVSYSVAYNGYEVSERVDFKWEFDPALEIDASTSGIELAMAVIVSGLDKAVSTGGNEGIKEAVENSVGRAKKKGKQGKVD